MSAAFTSNWQARGGEQRRADCREQRRADCGEQDEGGTLNPGSSTRTAAAVSENMRRDRGNTRDTATRRGAGLAESLGLQERIIITVHRTFV